MPGAHTSAREWVSQARSNSRADHPNRFRHPGQAAWIGLPPVRRIRQYCDGLSGVRPLRIAMTHGC